MVDINKDKCIGCGTCIYSCPLGAIKIDKNGKATINHKKCINCGACLNVCPCDVIKDD